MQEFREGYLIASPAFKERFLKRKQTTFKQYIFLTYEELHQRLFLRSNRRHCYPFAIVTDSAMHSQKSI